jgi:hypothetical protein
MHQDLTQDKYINMLELILIAVISFILGWKISEYFAAFALKKILEDLNIKHSDIQRLLEQEEKGHKVTQEISLRIESIRGEFLAYQTGNDAFIAQAATPDLLLERIIEKFPVGTKITFATDDDGALMLPAIHRLRR